MEPFIKLEQNEKEERSKRWVASRYNLQATDQEGDLLLSNTFSGSFINVPRQMAQEVRDLLKNGFDAFDSELTGLPKQMAERGFLIRSDVNELFRARMLHEVAGRRTDTLQLIFLITEQCNFRCVYCYEKFEKGSMSQDVREAVKKYVRKQARSLKYLNVHWFGGEPLLALDAIEELSREFLDICQEHEIIYNAAITTNGYLLSPEVAELLLDLQVKSFQITLDGDRSEHDKKRMRAGGQPTFERIWNHLLGLKDVEREYKARIRLNIDEDNDLGMPEFIRELKEHFSDDPRFFVNFFPVGQWGGPNDDELHVLPQDRAVKSVLSLCETSVDHGLSNVLDYLLKPGGSVCYAAKPNSFVIGSDGNVYKCTVALYHDKNLVGKIDRDGTMQLDLDKFALWIMNDESEDSGCKTCFFRPSCQGSSCPLIRIEQGVAPCPPEKKHIQKVMRIVGSELKKKRLENRSSL